MSKLNPWLDSLWATRPHECSYCRCRLVRKPNRPNTATVDHIQPRFNGGASEDGNIALVCKACNQEKANYTLAQLERRLRLETCGGPDGERRLRLIVEALREMEEATTA